MRNFERNEFIPFAVDIFGGFAPEALKLLRLLFASNLEDTKNCSRNVALNIVFRRISFSIHLGVARLEGNWWIV
jgi:hypothetical protein